MEEVIIREYRKDDKGALVELAKSGLSREFSVNRWDWLYHSASVVGSHIAVAEYEGRIVGSMGAVKKRFVWNDEEFVGGRHVDPVVDKSMRGKGVFSKILKVLVEMNNDVDFIYTFPNAASFRGFEKGGYTSIGPIPVGYCNLAFVGAGIKDKIKFFRTGLKLLGKHYTRVEKGVLEDLKGREWRKPLDRYSLKRDYTYLDWRYGQSPVKDYDILVCRDKKGEILSACIVTLEKGFLCIVDIVEYSESIEIEEYLLAIKRLYGPVTVWLWNNNVPGLNRFFWTRGWHNFMVRSCRKKMPDRFFKKETWYITHGEVESN